MLEEFPVVRAAFARTVRLVTTARLRQSVLKCLVDDDRELEILAEIEGATSTRLVAEDRGFESMNAKEFIFGVPHAKFINAAFAYAKPRALNRFNGPGKGAWYACLETETCVREVIYHMTDFLRDAGSLKAIVQYSEMFASLAGEYVDMRDQTQDCLNPDPAIGYPAGNAIADDARARGINGIIYASVRQAGGTCFAVLWPHAIQSVAQGDVIEIQWSGLPEPIVMRLPPASVV